MSAASLSYQLSRQHHICSFNKGMLHHSFGIAPSQSTKECALSAELCFCTCSQHNKAATVKSSNKMSDRFPPIRGTVRPQEPVLPPVVASPTTQRQSALHALPLPPVTVRTTQNTPVVDVVHAAQVPNMAPSAVAQPPIILTELDLLTIRQGGNLVAVYRGIVRSEDLSDVDRQLIWSPSVLHASPLPSVTARTTQNTPVVDVVRPAQAPNMAPSAVAQPPIILTELQFLAIRQVNNLHDLGFGRVRLEDLSDGDRQEINRITALRAAASS
ncbi:hypothetical protein PROFUN_14490 [Planoprotostelium fungivorum]|uniref:Uncharacterized protein n=1 Tax=Planoprotostelium fungivorum TaxID=1890364 RepID=A0A2P6MZG1_9EUKA|nr:hypothetical protein PROFUN_14490 [Planoprotostelium fungivorum]